MGILGTMTVNFTANVQGLQPSVGNKSAEEMQAIADAYVEAGKSTTAIDMVLQGILDIARAACEAADKALKDTEDNET